MRLSATRLTSIAQAGGGRTLIQRAIAVLRRFGPDAHVYLPGVGMLNGLQAGNYLDSAGTTQGIVDQPVGLVLDAAGGLGVELVTNGDFSNGLTGYLQNVPGYWSVAAGRAYHPFSPNYKELSQHFSGKAAGPTYRISFSQQVVSGAAQWFYINAAGVVAAKNISSTSPTTELVFSDGIQRIGFSREASGAEFYIDNISVREVTGIHASQTTTANKCILRQTGGRYNWVFDETDLLTATFPAGNESVTVIDALGTGQVTTTGVNVVGAYSMGPSFTLYGRMVIKGALSASELALLQSYANRLAGL